MVEHLIQQARRRFIWNAAFAQTALAVSVLAVGFILLLILGTRYLSAWSLAVFAAAGMAVAIYRLIRQIPDHYTAAVRLDQGAELHDALSTAYHFSVSDQSKPCDPGAAEAIRRQREQAESAASAVIVSVALPFATPRVFYVMAALALAASVLTGLRYRVGHGLDLQRPITEVLFEDQNAARPKTAAKARNPVPGEWSEQAQDLLSKLGIKADLDDTAANQDDPLDKAIEQALQQNAPNSNKSDQKGAGQKGGEQAKDGDKSGEQGNDPVDGGDKSGDDQKDASAKNSKGGNENGQRTPGKNGDADNGLLSKLKNAVSDMFAKTPQQQTNNQQQASDKKGANEQKDPSKQTGPGQGTPEQGNSNQDIDETDPNGAAMGGQKGKSNDSTSSNTPQKQEGSGIGLADGDKDIKAAEQLKAMGKISEIIGKRAAQVSGETMVEVQSGNQQLKTAYTNAKATHAETDGDVTRDQIPLALQPYVQQYFAEVHRADDAAAKGDAGAKKAPAPKP